MVRLPYFFFCLLFIITAPCKAAEVPNVIFINPGHDTHNSTGSFWQNVSLFGEAAAEDLGVNLTTYYAQRDHFYMRQLVKQAIKQSPDYLILVNEKSVGLSMLKQLQKSDVKVFFLLNDLTEKQYTRVPRRVRDRVIGGVQPNNYRAGYRLAKMLLDAQHLGPDHNYQFLALLGDHATQASTDREMGMLDALRASSVTYQLVDSPVANWSSELGFNLVNSLLTRELAVDLIWAANDAIAFGAQKAVRSHEKQSLIGGVNWDEPPEGSPLYVSVGGHVTLAGLALVYIYDFHHGKIAKPQHWVAEIFADNRTEFSQSFIELLSSGKVSEIDFRQFSLKWAENPRSYNIENLVLASQRP